MQLLQLCDPLFQYICSLNRLARVGATPDVNRVRHDLQELLQTIRTRASKDERLSSLYNESVELALIFFVDSMIRTSRLEFAFDWPDLAHDRQELAGDEKFYILLDETLKDRSQSAPERLLIFYTCMGLGFTGMLVGEPEQLKSKMNQTAGRVLHLIEKDPRAPLCPKAEVVDTSNLIQAPAASLTGIAITLIGLVLSLIAANVYLYHAHASRLTETMKGVRDQTKVALEETPASDNASMTTEHP